MIPIIYYGRDFFVVYFLLQSRKKVKNILKFFIFCFLAIFVTKYKYYKPKSYNLKLKNFINCFNL